MMRLPFKKLDVWVKAMELARMIFVLTKKFPKEELFGLVSPMRRSSQSVPSLIAEGSQRSTDKDFANFISMALGSLAELETQTIMAHDFGYVNDGELEAVCQRIDQLNRMLYALLKKLRQ